MLFLKPALKQYTAQVWFYSKFWIVSKYSIWFEMKKNTIRAALVCTNVMS